MTWIYAFPSWLFALLVVGAACTLACLGLSITRRRILPNEQISHNDVSGPILSTIGALLAVMLSFMVVNVWQQFDTTAAVLQREAGAMADVYHLAAFLPQPERVRIQSDVDRYLTQVIELDWPAMQRGSRSLKAHDTLFRVLGSVAGTSPRTPGQSQVQASALTAVQTAIDARRQRFHDNETGVPAILWCTMLFMSAVTLVVSFFFRVQSVSAHYTMVIALAAAIAISFVLIAELDYPFRGDTSLSPHDFIHEHNRIHGID
ncbi:MAG: DUF4239 domain-containing protein, partial [Candidatus Eremiobacteraeota bacterium]|nr:DUF4239 domain-containing protein [Candidatus Eremiobacteraeota bacterium]